MHLRALPEGCPDLQIRTLMVKKARMALQENQIKPLQLDYATIREMLPTATRDRVLRFIGQQHPGDIAVLFKVGAARSTATFRNLLFHSQSVQDTESAPTGTYQGLLFGSV
jgi:hypothetical protein